MLSMSRHIRLPAFIVVISFTIATFGCSTWRTMPTANATTDEWADLTGKRVELTTDDGVTILRVLRVEYPYMYGVIKITETRPGVFGPVESSTATEGPPVDLREVHNIRVRGPNTAVNDTLATVVLLVLLAGRVANAWTHVTNGTTN
jgi:hypothetical protein